MKTTTSFLRGLTVLCLLSTVLCLQTGCQSSLVAKLDAFEQAGVTEVTITGKFSNTEFTRVERDGQVISTLDHSNAWVPKVHIVRAKPAAK